MAGLGFSGRLFFLLAVIVCFIALVCETRRGGRGGSGSRGGSRYGHRSKKGGVVDYTDEDLFPFTSVDTILMYSVGAAVLTGGCYWCCCRNCTCRRKKTVSAHVSETRGGSRGGGGGSRGGSRFRSSRSSRSRHSGGSDFDDDDDSPGSSRGATIGASVIGAFIVVIVFCICRNVLRCCRCKKATPGSVKYGARPEPTPDGDNSIPTSKHTTTSHYKAARNIFTDDVTEPISSDFNVNDTKADDSDSGNKNSLPCSAEDSGYSSAGYSIGTANGLIYSAKPFNDPDKPFNDSTKPFNDSTKPFNDSTKPFNDSTKPFNDSTKPFNDSAKPSRDSDKPSNDSTKPSDDCSPGYSTGTSNGLPYSNKPLDDSASCVYPSPGYSTGTSNGLPYSAKPFDDSASCVYPSAGYSTGTSNRLPYSAKPFDDSVSCVYPSPGYSTGTSNGLPY